MQSIIYDVTFRAKVTKCEMGYRLHLPPQVTLCLGLLAGANLMMTIQEDHRHVRNQYLLLEDNQVLLPHGELTHALDGQNVMVHLHRLVKREE